MYLTCLLASDLVLQIFHLFPDFDVFFLKIISNVNRRSFVTSLEKFRRKV